MTTADADRCWARVSVQCPPQATDAVSALLMTVAANGVVVNDAGDHTVVTAYLSPTDDRDCAVAERVVREALQNIPAELLPRPLRIETIMVPERNWLAGFRAHCHPLREGRIVIKPTWEPWPSPSLPAREGDLVIEIDPGMAFGSGDHPTTRACLRALQEVLRPGDRVVDFGCGSGILSIAARLLGAGEVLAMDCDPLALRVARANLALNRVTEGVTLAQSDTLEGPAPGWDAIVANISASVLCAAAPAARLLLRPGGCFICAGVPGERRDQLVVALQAAGFADLRQQRDGEWVSVIATVPEGVGAP